MEEKNLVKVFEYPGTEKIWLNDVLDDNNIPYKSEVKPTWEGWIKAPNYQEITYIFVPEEYKKQVEKFIEEYSDPKNILLTDLPNPEDFKKDDSEQEEKFAKSTKFISGTNRIIGIIIFLMIFTPLIISIIFYMQ